MIQKRWLCLVFSVIKAEDVPGDNHYGTFNQNRRYSVLKYTISDMLALVAAETMEQARAAAQRSS